MNDAPLERLDHFMARANAEYYARHDPYADFTTAPEISQVFGEIIGLWAAMVWQGMGAPAPVLLAEAGPGRGTLMADALRAISAVVPDFRAALRLHLVETSAALRGQQKLRLPEARWHDSIADLPPGRLILIGNEFLDALPVRQFVRRGTAWTERWIRCSRFVELPAEPPARYNLDAPEGAVMEIREAADSIAENLGARFSSSPGAALFFDYASEYNRMNDSLQALREGRPADPLASPGNADITARVDFTAFAEAARAAGAAIYGPLPQGEVLTRLGLFQRTERLARGQPPARAAALLDRARRLAEPARMGHLFKAMAICNQGAPAPPGFEACTPKN